MNTFSHPNKNGRPAKDLFDKKACKVSLKMTAEEYSALKVKSVLAGISRSEYIRLCILSSKVRQRLSVEQARYIRLLASMANNVNQLARKANTAGFAEAHKECQLMVVTLDKVIKLIDDGC
jgi:hypothetical protein